MQIAKSLCYALSEIESKQFFRDLAKRKRSMAMVITVERFPSTKQKIAVGFTEQELATVEKVGARGSLGFPWGHRRNESTGVTPEARKYTVAHGENIAFGDGPSVLELEVLTVAFAVFRSFLNSSNLFSDH